MSKVSIGMVSWMGVFPLTKKPGRRKRHKKCAFSQFGINLNIEISPPNQVLGSRARFYASN